VLNAVFGPLVPGPVPDLDAWSAVWRPIEALDVPTGERAVRGGLAADRLAWAFVGGYASALRSLVPSLGPGWPALCATESGPVHPARIATRVEGGRLTGRKGFVTLGDRADTLLVLAVAGREQVRADLRLVRIDARAPGVAIRSLPPIPLIPEVGHAEVTFDGAAGDVLPGDGWADLVKPFRTVEDAHVHAAVLGWLVRVGRLSGWPAAIVERAAFLAVGAVAVAAADPKAPAAHLALAGAIAATRELVDAAPWDRCDPEIRARFERDRALDVATKARDARRLVAWDAMGIRPPD
jgi:acyl-CoA dehydrogenase